MAKAQVDPELRKQLKAGAASTAPIQAVIQLRSGRRPLSPERVRELSAELVGRLDGNPTTTDVNVFDNLGMFAISAAAPDLEKLISQPEVRSATANRPSAEPEAAPA